MNGINFFNNKQARESHTRESHTRSPYFLPEFVVPMYGLIKAVATRTFRLFSDTFPLTCFSEKAELLKSKIVSIIFKKEMPREEVSVGVSAKIRLPSIDLVESSWKLTESKESKKENHQRPQVNHRSSMQFFGAYDPDLAKRKYVKDLKKYQPEETKQNDYFKFSSTQSVSHNRRCAKKNQANQKVPFSFERSPSPVFEENDL